MYRQCELQRGTTGQVSWIPEIHAKVGNYLKITENGVTENGWKVVSVSDVRQTADYRREHERNYLTQRRASDI
jgi:hypothetical protein